MTKTIVIAPVSKTVTVHAPQAVAFDVFTNGLDRWWPKSHHIGKTPVVKEILEPRQGGRWYTIHEGGEEETTGHILVWDPPKRLVFTWEIGGAWKHEPDQKLASEVEVRFIAESATSTRVELEHRKFERMASGGQEMRDGVDKGWPGILELYKGIAES